MVKSKLVKDSGEVILKAYLALRSGQAGKASRIFAELNKNPKGTDAIMEGLAQALIRIKSMEDVEDTSMEDEEMMEDEDVMEDEEEMDAEFEDMEDDEMEDEEEMDMEEEEEEVSVPASVVAFLKNK